MRLSVNDGAAGTAVLQLYLTCSHFISCFKSTNSETVALSNLDTIFTEFFLDTNSDLVSGMHYQLITLYLTSEPYCSVIVAIETDAYHTKYLVNYHIINVLHNIYNNDNLCHLKTFTI